MDELTRPEDMKDHPGWDNLRRWRPEIEWQELLREVLHGQWQWALNTQCKYISLRIDTRDGNAVLFDRDGKNLTLDQIRWQYSKETPDRPPGFDG